MANPNYQIIYLEKINKNTKTIFLSQTKQKQTYSISYYYYYCVSKWNCKWFKKEEKKERNLMVEYFI